MTAKKTVQAAANTENEAATARVSPQPSEGPGEFYVWPIIEMKTWLTEVLSMLRSGEELPPKNREMLARFLAAWQHRDSIDPVERLLRECLAVGSEMKGAREASDPQPLRRLAEEACAEAVRLEISLGATAPRGVEYAIETMREAAHALSKGAHWVEEFCALLRALGFVQQADDADADLGNALRKLKSSLKLT